jgi:hypothetical protein
MGNKNVKFYNNGTIKSIKSYELQKSLAKGNVLSEDCNNKGLLCAGASSKKSLASIHMGNNAVSEHWGGGSVTYTSVFSTQLSQTPSLAVIQSDISGTWDISSTDIDKSDLSGGTLLPGSDPSANMPYGYIHNLIKIPRNLEGSGIIIDPSDNLFPNDSCGHFKHSKSHVPYMKLSNLKTYLVVSCIAAIYPGEPAEPFDCDDGSFVGNVATMGHVSSNLQNMLSGTVKSICCKRTLHDFTFFVLGLVSGSWNVFDMYIEIFNVMDYGALNGWLNKSPPVFDPTIYDINKWGTPFFLSVNITNLKSMVILPHMVESFRLIQGTIPPSLNQTTNNATKQSYMSCLENGTKNINFATSVNSKTSVIKGFCD